MTSIKCCVETGSVCVCESGRLSNDHTGSPDVVRSWAQPSPAHCLDQPHWFALVVSPSASCLGYLISEHSLKWFVLPLAILLN